MQLNILFGIKSVLENTGKPPLANIAKHGQRWLGQKNLGINQRKFEQKITMYFSKETLPLMT